MKPVKAKCPANTQRNRQKSIARKTRERSKVLHCIVRPLHRMPVLDLITPQGLEASCLVMAKLDKLASQSRPCRKARTVSAIEAAFTLAINSNR